MLRTVFSFWLVMLSVSWLSAQLDYPTVEDLNKQLKALERQHQGKVTLTEIAKSPGGHPIYAIELGKENDFKTGIAFVSGIDGRHPAGVQINLGLLKSLLEGEQSLLDSKAFYFIPLVNPDAYQQLHAKIKYERQGNGRETDEDRDGRLNEDSYDDMNNDGWITQIRIQDPSGNMVLHKEHKSILEPLKVREAGTVIYRLIDEGIDNDKDGNFNEDGPGGVHIYKNFPFQYEAFSHGAGEHAMSEVENRALADYLFDRWNIHTVFHFALENNLNDPDKYDKNKQSKRIKTGPFEKDGSVNEKVSTTYKKVSSTSNHPNMPIGNGSFSSWAYFHYGRFSYVTPGWWAPVLEPAADTTSVDKSKKKGANDISYDLRYMLWADSMGINDYFVEWTPIEHPDFPGLKAEVGGFKPFVRHNPPRAFLDSTIQQHLNFVKAYSDMLPNLEFQEVKVDKLDSETFRISGKVVNTGLLPTHSELGDKTRWVRKMRNRIILDRNQTVVLGNDKTFHEALQSGETFHFSWLVNGKGKVTLEAGSPMTGLKTYSLELK